MYLGRGAKVGVDLWGVRGEHEVLEKKSLFSKWNKTDILTCHPWSLTANLKSIAITSPAVSLTQASPLSKLQPSLPPPPPPASVPAQALCTLAFSGGKVRTFPLCLASLSVSIFFKDEFSVSFRLDSQRSQHYHQAMASTQTPPYRLASYGYSSKQKWTHQISKISSRTQKSSRWAEIQLDGETLTSPATQSKASWSQPYSWRNAQFTAKYNSLGQGKSKSRANMSSLFMLVIFQTPWALLVLLISKGYYF